MVNFWFAHDPPKIALRLAFLSVIAACCQQFTQSYSLSENRSYFCRFAAASTLIRMAVSDGDLADIYAFLLSRPQSTQAKSIQLLNQ